jgi:hypothetical protein
MQIQCKLKGIVDPEECFFCFMSNSRGFASRVQCKKKNGKNLK